MRNIETYPSKQMYPYLSLVERKVAEFFHNMDVRRYSVWLLSYFHQYLETFDGVLVIKVTCVYNSSTVL